MSISYRQRSRDANARQLTVLEREAAPTAAYRANPTLVSVAVLPDVYPVRPIIVRVPASSPRRVGPRPEDWLLLPGLLSSCVVVALIVACWPHVQTSPSAAAETATMMGKRPLLRVDEAPLDLPLRLEAAVALRVEPAEEDIPEPLVEAPSLPSPPRGKYNTAVPFHDDPVEAARQAQLGDKLWFVVTISGNFEESCFT